MYRTPDANMKMRPGQEKPLNLNGQINAAGVGLPPDPSEMWPTPRAGNPGSRPNGKGGKVLAEEVKKPAALWPTPRNNTGASTDRKHLSLDGAVKLWPTPDTRGFTNSGSLKTLKEKAGNFEEFAGMAYRQGAEKKEKLWGTPTANDAKNSLAGSQAGRGTLTAHIVESLWPTPRTAGMCGGTGNWERLKEKCASIGEVRQMGAGNGGQLNPDWVEALMGYPLGWTDIDKEDSELRDQMYPATWRDGTWEKGIPRIVSESKNRTNRLKGLGNAVVPQIPAVLWTLVARAFAKEQNGGENETDGV